MEHIHSLRNSHTYTQKCLLSNYFFQKIYLFKRQCGREREREAEIFHPLTPHITTAAEAGPCQRKEPGALCMSPTCMTGTLVLGPRPLQISRNTGSEVQGQGFKPAQPSDRGCGRPSGHQPAPYGSAITVFPQDTSSTGTEAKQQACYVVKEPATGERQDGQNTHNGHCDARKLTGDGVAVRAASFKLKPE